MKEVLVLAAIVALLVGAAVAPAHAVIIEFSTEESLNGGPLSSNPVLSMWPGFGKPEFIGLTQVTAGARGPFSLGYFEANGTDGAMYSWTPDPEPFAIKVSHVSPPPGGSDTSGGLSARREGMELSIMVALLILILLIASVAAVGAWRMMTASRLSRGEIEAAERRLLAGVYWLRDSVDGAMRDAAQEGSKAQRELAIGLAATVERSPAEMQTTIIDRFLAVEQRLGEGISEARRSQDERLERVGARLHESPSALREGVGRALGDFGSEVKSSLGQAQRSQEGRLDTVEEALQGFAETFHKAIGELKASLLLGSQDQIEAEARATSALRDGVTQTLGELTRQLTDAQTEARKEQTQGLLSQKGALEDNGEAQVKDNEAELEKIRQGLGEMRTLATDVGDLKRVLTNVRSPDSSERVECAVKLPGRDDAGSVVFPPIDAKFLQEDSQCLQQALEEGVTAAVDVHPGLCPLAVDGGRGRQRAEGGPVESLEQLPAAGAVQPHAAATELDEQLGDARVEGAEREESLVAQPGQDGRAVVLGELLVGALQAGLVATGHDDATPELVAHDGARHAAEKGEGPGVANDPVEDLLGAGGLGVGVAGRSEDGHEELDLDDLAGGRVQQPPA